MHPQHGPVATTGEWRTIAEGDAFDARQGPQAAEQRLIEGGQGVADSRALRGVEAQRQDPVGVEARAHGDEIGETPRHHAGSGEQHERQRELDDDERIPAR